MGVFLLIAGVIGAIYFLTPKDKLFDLPKRFLPTVLYGLEHHTPIKLVAVVVALLVLRLWAWLVLIGILWLLYVYFKKGIKEDTV